MQNQPPDPIGAALAEDIGKGDVTSGFFVPPSLQAFGRIVARERAIVAGVETAAEVFHRVDASLNVEFLQPDGSSLLGGETIHRSPRLGPIHPHRGARGAELPPAPLRHRDPHPAIRRWRRQVEGEDSRHTQDHARLARAWKRRRSWLAVAQIIALASSTWCW